MKHLIFASAMALTIAGCAGVKKAPKIAILPQPVSVVNDTTKADFILRSPITITFESGNAMLEKAANFYCEILSAKFGGSVTVTDKESDGAIELKLSDTALAAEGYEMDVDKDGIEIKVSDYSGAVYALQTLLQLMPTEVYAAKLPQGSAVAIPAVDIKDYPRFGWRGMHLDCARHFFNADEVKKYIDYLYMNKLNRFHWHLSDDQGWRFESKKHPILTQKSAWRVDRNDQPWNDRKWIDRAAGEEASYGGFYSQDQIRDIVAYAEARGVVVVPEIDVPGHSASVFASYPELSCTGKLQEVTPGGVYPDSMACNFCAGNDASFKFLEGIFDELIELFPNSPYIHIGGDEVNKTMWKNCPKCQARMKTEGLKTEEELQSYFIHRIEKYINGKGRKIIGWDEIMEGGIAPNATVMSWRGEQGGIDAARMGYDVIMTPNSYLYFDYYQNDPESEPEAMGGFITAKRVYSYEPIPSVLNEQEAKHILGAQANLWAELLPTFTDIERMAITRMAALGEVDWSPKSARDWASFSERLEVQKERYAAMGAAYHKGAQTVDYDAKFDEANGKFNVILTSEIFGTDIHYTLDGSEPTVESPKYTTPFEITTSTTIKSIIAKAGVPFSDRPSVRTIGVHKALGKSVTYGRKPAEAYLGNNGQGTLVDGFTGTTRSDDGYMQGFNSGDFDVTIDLGQVQAIKAVTPSFMQSVGIWCYLPSEVVVSTSTDGKTWAEMGRKAIIADPKTEPAVRREYKIEKPVEARYIKVVGLNPPTAAGLPGGGTKNWIFADEILVD